MINDPIPSGQVKQLLCGVVVLATSDGNGDFSLTFLNQNGHFRAAGPYSAFGTTLEVGEHWHIAGEWSRNEEIGDYFSISTADLTLPELDTLPIWLQHNVLGMGSWFAKKLCQFFGEELPTLLLETRFERLLTIKSEARRMGPRLLLDACAAWRQYQSQVISVGRHVPVSFRRHALQALSFFGSQLPVELQSGHYRMTYFSGVDAIDSLQLTDTSNEIEINRRLLAIVDILVSRWFQAGDTLIHKLALQKEIDVFCGESHKLGQRAVDQAVSSGRLRIYDDSYVQGNGVTLLVRKLEHLLMRLGWSSSKIRYSETLTDLNYFLSDHAERSNLWVLNFGALFPSPVNTIISLLLPHIDSIQFLSVHADELRIEHSRYSAHFSHPGEIVHGDDTSHQNRRCFLFLELHAWDLSTLIQVLQRIAPGCSCVFCGAEFGNFLTKSPWGDIVKAAKGIAASDLPISPQVEHGANLLRALFSGVATKIGRYKKDGRQNISCVDIPDDQLINAAVGVAFQLCQIHGNVQILSTEMGLLPALNIRMQAALQELSASKQEYFGASKFCVGDRVIQTAAWADSMPVHRVGIISEIFRPPLISRSVHGNLKRYRLRVHCNGTSYDLSRAEASSLQLAHALGSNVPTHSSSAATIIVSRSFNELELSCLTRGLKIAGSQVVFVGDGSSSVRTVGGTCSSSPNSSVLLNGLRAHHHEISH